MGPWKVYSALSEARAFLRGGGFRGRECGILDRAQATRPVGRVSGTAGALRAGLGNLSDSATGSLLAWVQRSKVQRLKELNTFLLIFFTYLSSAMFLQNHHCQKNMTLHCEKPWGTKGQRKTKQQSRIISAQRPDTPWETKGHKGRQSKIISAKLYVCRGNCFQTFTKAASYNAAHACSFRGLKLNVIS